MAKASGWYTQLMLQANISVPDVAAAQVVMQRGLVLVADGQSVRLSAEEGGLGTAIKPESPSARK